ncbi:RNA polymerase sigma-70 factor (ECF subfamily) [Prauserella shujinwangii]|uniref:RNA polymerase sigma-70 factor (ECF subfamily) n=1 Tax=Prauserella shujinwangii TaxID=1453103 RepID=A0A2T0LUW9_9PSEU|nr:sigma-70 family RNA polymerase sigma factor [Prauserella shujinwangii]PRX47624.1 RNA polymerase sigma-70 factor (ECF subfamily) [Prauserella shujinwangii]
MRAAGVVEHLFRHSSGQIVATLVRTLGPDRLDLAEESVADALEQALRTWPHAGVPANPRGWLFRAARNRAIDLLRRERALRARLPALAELGCAEQQGGDAELALMLLCCHPELPPASQVALTLKTVGGLGVDEIAAALLTRPATVAQRLTRARRWLRESGNAIELPPSAALEPRVDSVLAVLYLLFNEGYDATSGEAAVRGELCGESIRLGRLLLADRRTDLPRARALVALMLLQASRLPARVDAGGDIVLLDEQDRTRWDRAMIAEGTRLFGASCTGPELSAYHVEAAIALCHAAADAPGDTDWPRVLGLYDQLVALRPAPVTRLNRAIALGMAYGPAEGIAELERLEGDKRLAAYGPLPAALGALWLRAGERERAAAYYRRALDLPGSEPRKRFLRRRLADCAERDRTS